MNDFPNIDYPEHEIDGVVYLQVGREDDLPTRTGRNIYFDEETQIAIFKIDDSLYAVSNICPHQHAAVIYEGLIEDETVTCPLHGWIYSLETGRALGGNTRLKTYRIFSRDGDVYLEKPQPVRPKWLDNF